MNALNNGIKKIFSSSTDERMIYLTESNIIVNKRLLVLILFGVIGLNATVSTILMINRYTIYEIWDSVNDKINESPNKINAANIISNMDRIDAAYHDVKSNTSCKINGVDVLLEDPGGCDWNGPYIEEIKYEEVSWFPDLFKHVRYTDLVEEMEYIVVSEETVILTNVGVFPYSEVKDIKNIPVEMVGYFCFDLRGEDIPIEAWFKQKYGVDEINSRERILFTFKSCRGKLSADGKYTTNNALYIGDKT